MNQKLSDPVSVQLIYNHKTSQVYPHRLFWKNKNFVITKQGLHHTYYEGKYLYHIFSVVSDQLFFRLKLSTQDLTWTLEEISDGLPD